ncbi:hypothetical protein ABZT04_07430 [Streptomyces sp. NPDC005492]|uniref:hypothetical protein n=1 Tax=Streptomyces sp. NPDC005492 TaxID=3156883 RepID=UPI0033BF4ECB
MPPTSTDSQKGIVDPVKVVTGRAPGRTDTRQSLNAGALPTGWDDRIDEPDQTAALVIAMVEAPR